MRDGAVKRGKSFEVKEDREAVYQDGAGQRDSKTWWSGTGKQ